jgi:microcystin-dependent protein
MATPLFVFANFFESELVAGLTASSTTMIVSPNDAAKLPVIPAVLGQEARIVIWDGQLPPEIVSVVANDQSGAMTIVRAEEGSTAQAWAAGTQVRCAITAEVLNTALAAYFDFLVVLNANFLKLAGGTLTGPLLLAADPVVPLGAATKQYVDNSSTSGLPLTGGTMQGPINMNTLPILNVPNPSGPQDAASKSYVDTAVASKANLDSPTFTGTPAAPTQAPGDGSTRLATTAYVDAAAGGASGAWSTGDVKLTLKTIADIGWIFMDDTSIGAAASPAVHASAVFQSLFTLIWNNVPDSWAPVGGGRGASANADWTGNKAISLPKALGRALASAGGGAGLTTRVLGSNFGEENHTLTVGELPSHTHSITDVAHSHGMHIGNYGAGGGAAIPLVDGTGAATPVPNTNTAFTGLTGTNAQGGGTSHNVIQPSTFLNVMIKI